MDTAKPLPKEDSKSQPKSDSGGGTIAGIGRPLFIVISLCLYFVGLFVVPLYFYDLFSPPKAKPVHFDIIIKAIQIFPWILIPIGIGAFFFLKYLWFFRRGGGGGGPDGPWVLKAIILILIFASVAILIQLGIMFFRPSVSTDPQAFWKLFGFLYCAVATTYGAVKKT